MTDHRRPFDRKTNDEPPGESVSFRAKTVSIRVGGDPKDGGWSDGAYDVELIGLGSNVTFDYVYPPDWAPRIPKCCGGNSVPEHKPDVSHPTVPTKCDLGDEMILQEIRFRMSPVGDSNPGSWGGAYYEVRIAPPLSLSAGPDQELNSLLDGVGTWQEGVVDSLYSHDTRGQCATHATWGVVGIGGRKCDPSFGRFIFRELEINSDCSKVVKMALDFEHHCMFPSSPPLFGFVRLNSSLEIRKDDYVENWQRERGEKYAARTISMKGDYIGKGESVEFTNSFSAALWETPAAAPVPGRPGTVMPVGQKGLSAELHTGRFSAYGENDKKFEIKVGPPKGEMGLDVGVWYDNATNYNWWEDNDNNTGKGFLHVSSMSDYCEVESVLGRFIVREATVAGDVLSSSKTGIDSGSEESVNATVFLPCDIVQSFALDFQQSCDGAAGMPPLFGSVRINSTVPIDDDMIREYQANLPPTPPPTRVPTRRPYVASHSSGRNTLSPYQSPGGSFHGGTTPIATTQKDAPMVTQITVAGTAGLLFGSTIGCATRNRFPDPNRNPVLLGSVVLLGALFGIVGGAAAAGGCLLTQWLLGRNDAPDFELVASAISDEGGHGESRQGAEQDGIQLRTIT